MDTVADASLPLILCLFFAHKRNKPRMTKKSEKGKETKHSNKRRHRPKYTTNKDRQRNQETDKTWRRREGKHVMIEKKQERMKMKETMKRGDISSLTFCWWCFFHFSSDSCVIRLISGHYILFLPFSVSLFLSISFVPEPSSLLLQSFVSFVTYIIHSNILFLPQLFSPSHEIINCYFSPFFFFASFDSFDCLPSKWSTLFNPRGFCASDSILVKDEKRVRKEEGIWEEREWCKA